MSEDGNGKKGLLKGIEGVIFDMDGTLIDSMKAWDHIGEDYLKSRGIQPKSDLAERLSVMSLHQAAEYFIAEYGVSDSIEQIIEAANNAVREKYEKTIPLKDGVKEFLSELERRKIKMCVATATEQSLAEKVLKRLGILKYFCFVLSCTDLRTGKDNPYIYELAGRRMGIGKENSLVVEDAFHAVKTAARAGYSVLAVYDESAKKEKRNIEETADWYIESMRDWERLI
jgi:HAD superfamily hydrolase (TIGR01509 family)